MMAEAVAAGSVSTTEVINSGEQENIETPPVVLRLKLKKPKNQKKVNWTTETVDNEHMNKMKSKCCCIYEKPRIFGESSESEDDECDHQCRGHVEKPTQNPPSSNPTPPSAPPVT